ncbi:MAG TPA: class I SAM-dependent DNA methyltransferase [Fimbriiglobus sp.]|nr:class I SAM-dependent DNA methyltransferase [Fimbriiglobus sp.]
MAKQSRKATAPLTTAQRLGSLLKSARDVMRKDKGLNGDLDRLPLLTWLMFLKFLDDQEQLREERAKLKREKFRPTIAGPYRWRDWAAKEDGITGDELRKFLGHDEVILDGAKREGLLKYLRGFVGSAEPRQRVVGDVFSGVQSRMESGYLLRDIINKVNGIHFASSEEIHTLGHLYESMLKEMRDAAGDSGEFYTPRAVVRFMVAVTNPRLGEVILDPAAGTGGFMVEAYSHLEKQCKTVEHRRTLQDASIVGHEAKPLPFMLCQMNLLLHGLEAPRIVRGNSLEQRLTDITESQRVDVILTNPPFGGEEERGILSNFPEDKQTAETALLFLQLIMRRLKSTPKPGRAAVVVPHGVLFGDGICARIKQELLAKFNLHTVVRLPNGVFAPYTDIPTNILFFDRSGPTEHVWYYEQPLPEGRKKYSKTAPLQFEEFADCIAWWPKRAENDRAWKVPAERIAENGYNLDIKNPNAKADFEHLPPEQLADDILRKELRIAEIMREIKELLGRKP